MYDLTRFTLSHMGACGAELRKLGTGADTMEAVARRTVGHLYQALGNERTGEPSCALVRLFKTHPFGELPATASEAACQALQGQAPPADTQCLTLLATAGAEPAWNDRTSSSSHQAIPLLSEQMIEEAPMIANLIRQFGLPVSAVLAPRPELLVDASQQTYNVFYVPQALGSAYVPAQGFVKTYGIESVLGFGGMLPSGHLFAAILFSKVAIPKETATFFQTLALNVKVALLPFDGGPIFAEEVGACHV